MSAPWRDQLAAILLREARPVDKFGHQPRLYMLTRAIGTGLEYDDDVVFAAAFLHDLGVFIGHRPEDTTLLARWDHVAYTLDRTPAILSSVGFPASKLPAVLECIRNHQPRDTPRSIESTILRDADIIEQLGAIGILRTVAKVGRDTRFSTFTQAIASLRSSLETLPGLILLPSTQALAQPRIATLRAFLDSANSEAGPHLH